MTEDKNRCVVTGLGVICAIGNNVEETWNNALNSVSGIHKTVTVDTTDCYADLAAEVHCDTLDELENPQEKDRVSKLCIKAAKEALKDSGLSTFDGSERVSVIIGSCVGGVQSIDSYVRNGKKTEDIAKMPIAAIASQVAETVNAGGMVTNIGNACAAGTMSINYACDLIRAGKADVVIAGGADTFAAVPYSGFLALHALDENGCSPFNKCHGITLGEGSGIVIVESYEHAQKRNAKVYCEVLGGAVTGDAHHITAPREDAYSQIFAMRRALKNSGLTEKDIGYVNAHGTGTGKNDGAEFVGLHTLFDETNPTVSASSTKAMTGHCLGAAGSIEAVLSIKSLLADTVLPTLGYSDEDLVNLKEKAGSLDMVANKPHAKELKNVLSNNYAFGGTDSSIIFSKEKGDVSFNNGPKTAVISGIGLVTPLGNSKEAYIAAVKEGKKVDSNSVASSISTEDYDSVGLKMAFYRKLDKMGQMHCVSGLKTLQDAKWTVDESNEFKIGAIVGTSEGALGSTYDFQELITEKGNAKGSAFKFPNTVYNAAGGYFSICSGIKGYQATITTGPSSGLSSVSYAMSEIRNAQVDAVVTSGLDENTEIVTNLFNQLGYVSSDAAVPYANKKGFAMGDGSVSMMIETEESAKARGVKTYCKVLGTGSGRVNVKFGKLSSSGAGLDAAIKDALNDSGVKLEEIDGIFGFADGFDVVDNIEKEGLSRVFGSRLSSVPVFNVKERNGEGRAAGAALSCAHAALMLSGDLDKDEAYIIDGNSISRKTVESSSLNKVLILSFASGGSYACVVLSR